MTVREMALKFMATNHYRLKKGSLDSAEPLVPFFLMDAGDQFYNKYVRALPLAREAKRARSKWHESYLAFNRCFTASYNTAEREEVNDLMDRFQDYIAHDVEITRINGTNCFCDTYGLDDQLALAGILMTNQLAVDAQTMWHQMHGRDSRLIDGVLQWSKTTAEYIMSANGVEAVPISEKKYKQLEACEKALLMKTLRWIREQ